MDDKKVFFSLRIFIKSIDFLWALMVNIEPFSTLLSIETIPLRSLSNMMSYEKPSFTLEIRQFFNWVKCRHERAGKQYFWLTSSHVLAVFFLFNWRHCFCMSLFPFSFDKLNNKFWRMHWKWLKASYWARARFSFTYVCLSKYYIYVRWCFSHFENDENMIWFTFYMVLHKKYIKTWIVTSNNCNCETETMMIFYIRENVLSCIIYVTS